MKNVGLVGLAMVLLTSGCASIPSMQDTCDSTVMQRVGSCIEEAEVVKIPTYQELTDLPPAETMPIVAVYGLEMLVVVIQAYVFTILTCVYLNDALHPGH